MRKKLAKADRTLVARKSGAKALRKTSRAPARKKAAKRGAPTKTAAAKLSKSSRSRIPSAKRPSTTRLAASKKVSRPAISRAKKSSQKHSIRPETISSLSRALDALVSSPRFEFVKRLQAGELVVKVGDPGALKDFCLEDLAMLGAEEVSRIAKVDARILDALSEVIQGMAIVTPGTNFESPGLMPSSAPAIDFPVTQRSRYPTPDSASFSSSEAELKLITLLTKLKSMSSIGQYYNKRLGDFWKPEWTKAPFEQQMTIRQVLEINIDAVLKKRSFTGQKLSAFMQALERIADEAGRSNPADRELREPAPSPKSFSKLSVPTSTRFTLLGLENDLYRLPSAHPLRRVFYPLSEWLSAESAAGLRAAIDAQAPHGTHEEGDTPLSGIEAGLLLAVKSRIAERAPNLLAAWNAALSGPAVAFTHFISQELSDELDEPLQNSLFRLILQALGAQPLYFRGIPLEDHWALTPKSFAVLFESFLAGLPRPEAEVSRELTQLFPLGDQGILLGLIANYAELNELGIWYSRAPALH